ncbi:Cytochrome c-type biogenesis protein CcmH [Patescibacteria group bacterium]|nr:Cytochrome c-type biogenesis protein CcmH [Patescibacteria group bacterium]
MKVLILSLCLLLSPAIYAVDSYTFKTPEQQQDYKTLVSELRCLVCQNQTIGDSNADLAADLRRQVYEMLQQGKSKDEILQFMTQRYGDFVLYNPPFKATTSLLWLAPVTFLVIGLITLIIVVKRKKTAQTETNSEQLNTARRLLDDSEL